WVGSDSGLLDRPPIGFQRPEAARFRAARARVAPPYLRVCRAGPLDSAPDEHVRANDPLRTLSRVARAGSELRKRADRIRLDGRGLPHSAPNRAHVPDRGAGRGARPRAALLLERVPGPQPHLASDVARVLRGAPEAATLP